jgi:hypothetical protein
VTSIDEIGETDGWRCWLCDEPVDPDGSVHDDRGPSIDRRITDRKAKSKKKANNKKAKNKNDGATAELGRERLAHRSCNTGKGGIDAVIPWADDLFVVDPAPIIPTMERLATKGGREAMARCPSAVDADAAATWLIDRVSRLFPDLELEATVEAGGGQYVLVVRA